jgi:hypothetical protein
MPLCGDPPGAAVNLTANQKRALRRLWSGDLDLLEIAEDLTFSTYLWVQDGEECEILTFDVAAVVQAAKALGLDERSQVEIFVPTPEQIRVAAALIREGWTQREREDRRKSAWLSGILEDATEADKNNAGGSTSPDSAEGDSADL